MSSTVYPASPRQACVAFEHSAPTSSQCIPEFCSSAGNVFREQCPSCGKEYVRNFDVTARSAYRRHGTQRVCERKACARAELRDTIVYFGEKIASSDLSQAQEHSEKADLAIFIGSSLKVLQHYKFIWQQPPKPARKRFVIINLQVSAVAERAISCLCMHPESRLDTCSCDWMSAANA